MKVHVYSKFIKNKIWKKLKSTCSMKEGRFHPPKYRGKVQKRECSTSILPKCRVHLHNTKSVKIAKIVKQEGPAHSLTIYGLRPAGDQWSLTSNQTAHGWLATNGRLLTARGCPKLLSSKTSLLRLAHNFCTCGQFLISCWLAPIHTPALPRFLLKFSIIHNF
jgi:hypothetical protein